MRAHVFVLVMLLAPPALADGTEAERRFDEGRQLLEAGRAREAAEQFRQSQALAPSVGALLNWGDCLERLGQTASAYARFREAEALAASKNDLDRMRESSRRKAQIEPSLSWVHVVVADPDPAMRVRVDTVETVSLDMPLDPGEHTLVVSAPGRATFSTKFPLGARADQQRVFVPRLAPLGQPDTHAWASAPTRFRDEGYVVTAAGVVGLGLATAFGIASFGTKSDLKQICPSYPDCPFDRRDQALTLDDRGRTQATIATVAFVAGAALVIGGLALVLAGPKARTTARSW